MSENIKIKWLGHSCFKIEYKEHSLIIDPYREVPGYPELHCTAGAVYASHLQHDDHAWFSAVEIVQEPGAFPFEVSVIPCFHDNQQGALRGENNITRIKAAGKTIVHMGDLGHMPDEYIIKEIRNCDIAMIPIGGFYTIGPDEAAEVMYAVDPVVTIPMHYRTDGMGFDVISEPESFMALINDRKTVKSGTSVFEVTDNMEKCVVQLTFERA